MIATGLSASDREDPLQQERDYLFKRVLLRKAVTFRNTTFFQAKKKSSKKSRRGHLRLCPPLWLRTVHRTVLLTRRARNALKVCYLKITRSINSTAVILSERSEREDPLQQERTLSFKRVALWKAVTFRNTSFFQMKKKSGLGVHRKRLFLTAKNQRFHR